MKQAEEVRSSM